jgi:hypothetical protein
MSLQKITVRFRGLLLAVFLVIPFVFFFFSYKSWQHGWTPLVKSDSDYYWVYGPFGYRGFDRALVEQEVKVEDSSLEANLSRLAKEVYQENIALGESFQTSQRRSFFTLLFFGVVTFLVTVFFWVTSKIELAGGEIVTTAPLLRKKEVIKIAGIKSLRFETAFPLVGGPSSKKDLGWQHKVVVDDGEAVPAVFSLSAFPGFTKIIEVILKERPQIKCVFSKKERS